MAATLDDAWARVEWAYWLLGQLTAALGPFEASEPFDVREEISPDGTQRILTAEQAGRRSQSAAVP